MMMESAGDSATLPMGTQQPSQRNQYQALSRPNSLLGPEKEPINFHMNLVGAPESVEQLIEHIKQVASQFLYHWKTFPINLPQPISSTQTTQTSITSQSGTNLLTSSTTGITTAVIQTSSVSTTGTNRKSRANNLRDLFILPPFDELDAVAADSSGEPRRLTNNQLKSLRERGEFEVQSLNFPGQVHRWRLSQFLQKGSERTRDSLLSDLALAARFIVITARARIFGHFFSLKHAVKAFLDGLLKLLDMIVGTPSLLAHNLDNKIKEERCRYLVAELVCPPEYEDCLDSLCTYVRNQLRRATMEKFDVNYEATAQPVPYIFVTPKNQEIDLRLFSRDIMRKALPILVGILEKETRGWFLHFRERLIAELREKKMTDAEIEEEVNDAVMKEYLQRVYTSVLSNSDLKDLGDGVPQLLVQQAQTVVIMHKAIEKVKKDVQKTREEYEKYLIENNPVLSKIGAWLRAKLEAAETSKINKTIWGAHEEAVRVCLKHNLQQSVYFLNRDLSFMKEREPVLLKELKNAKKPTRNFTWALRIWSPKSWIIRRNFQGQSEIIPTVISQQVTSIVTPRSDPSQPVFLVEKEIVRTTSTRWPMWRLLNLLQRIWTWTWNIMFLLGIVVPWSSPLGLRALFSVKPFMSDLELSQINGTLFPRKTSVTQTMASRLIELWRHISKSRTHFETEPDTGFIGKGLTRHLNRVYNYFVKGFLGTVLILFVFPILCISVSLSSLFFAITAPLTVPVAAILLHLYMMLIYDLDSPDDDRNKYCIFLEAIGWNVMVQGILQPILALLVAAILCPLASVAVLMVGFSRYWLRIFWDSIVFHTFIKKCGRVPASDSFAVKRIAGPGLALDYFFSIKPEQALASFEAKMELDELQAWQHSMETIICQPQKDFSQFVEACFGPFSAQLSKSGPYRQLERECQDLLSCLHEKLEKRRRELQLGLSPTVRSRIKLSTMDLKVAIQLSAYMLEKFFPTHVIGRLSMTEDEFWDAKGLSVGDWAGLAGLLYADIFSLDFLTPLSDSDTQFKLEPHPQIDLGRYTAMVQNTSDIMGVNAPDLLGNVYTPRGNIQVQSPYLEVSAFNPRSRLLVNTKRNEKRKETSLGLTTLRVRVKRPTNPGNNTTSTTAAEATKIYWKPWKRKEMNANKWDSIFLIPLPVPHPVFISISIFNRDSDQPITIDSDLCWDVLRSIEDCYGDIQAMNSVARYRGGGIGIDSSMDSLGTQSSGDTKDSMDIVGGTETLPCTNRAQPQQQQTQQQQQINITSNTQEMLTENLTNRSHSNSISSLHNSNNQNNNNNNSNNNVTTPSSYHWTLSNLNGNNALSRRRNNSNSNNTETVRVDLASPEDISLDTDSSRVVFNASAYGTTV